MIRLLLADDQSLFRQSLSRLLALEPEINIVGQAAHGREAISLAEQLQPDVVLMDVRMPICDGVVATREIHEQFPWIRILVLTTFDEDDYIRESLQAGALGYLLKSTPSKQLISAIRTVHQGHGQLGPTIAPKVFAQTGLPSHSKTDYHHWFSPSELEVLILLGQGKSNQEISQALHRSEGTVKNHVTRILSQLGVRDRTQAALWAKQHLRF
jgi:DNA-binding NarL/FixJ family response regulator